MDNKIKENDLMFDGAIVVLDEDKGWKFLANTDYNIDTQTMALISKILNRLLAEQAKNKKLIKDFGIKYIEWEKTFLDNKKLVEALKKY